jgi:hypothetical protein
MTAHDTHCTPGINTNYLIATSTTNIRNGLPQVTVLSLHQKQKQKTKTAKQATWQPHKNNTAHQKHMRSTWVPRVFTIIRK